MTAGVNDVVMRGCSRELTLPLASQGNEGADVHT